MQLQLNRHSTTTTTTTTTTNGTTAITPVLSHQFGAISASNGPLQALTSSLVVVRAQILRRQLASKPSGSPHNDVKLSGHGGEIGLKYELWQHAKILMHDELM